MTKHISIVLLALSLALAARLLFFPSFDYIGERDGNGLPSGIGTGIYSNGLFMRLLGDADPLQQGVYNGEWKDGKREGKGAFVSYGNRFEGDWRDDDLRYGKAEYTDFDHFTFNTKRPLNIKHVLEVQSRASISEPPKHLSQTAQSMGSEPQTASYEGFFFHLMPHGKGKMTCGSYSYDGQWSLGRRSGFAIENGKPLALFEDDELQDVNVITDKRIYGIDISHYQPVVRWDKLYVAVDSSYTYNDTIEKQIGVIPVSFVFLKATEGGQYVDSEYKKHCDWAERFGIPHGAYHFYNHREATIQQQISNFTNHVKLQKGDLLPVLDIEIFGVPTDSLLTWVDAVEKHYGVKPIIYANERISQSYIDNTKLKDYTLWHARYGRVPTRPFHIHQYSETGHIKGIEHHEVDLDTLSQDLTVKDLLHK